MGENTNIEWCHHTFNMWRGCTKISEGCKHCYAETLSKRNPATLGVWGDNGTRVVAVDSYWKQPLKWNKAAEGASERPRVFCASLADVFEDRLELAEPRNRLFELIDRTPNLDWLLLTKRPQNIQKLWPFGWYDDQFTWPNVWLGTTVENQEQADKRIPELLKIPAKVRFLSCEPLLERVDLLDVGWQGRISQMRGVRAAVQPQGCLSKYGIHWVICGGESGSNARPMQIEWARSLRDQCQASNVAFHFKQFGEHAPTSEYRDGKTFMSRVGKKAAGRILDGRTWDQYPQAA